MLKITKRKGWRTWLFTVIALCFASNIAAQVTVEIGTGTTTVGYPYYTLYEDSRTQMIYDASEIIAAGGEAGEIVSIAFNVQAMGSPGMNGFSLDMQNYSGSTLGAFENAGWTNTYSGSYTVAGTGWQTITLTTPFDWDGTSNLLINLCWDNAAWSGNSYVYATASTNKVWHQHTDGAAGCALAVGSTQTSRPNIQMTINTGPPPPPPLSIQVGTGTATSQYPYYTYWMDSRSQYLYTASEILAAGGLPGDITAIGFNVSTSDPYVMNGFNVDMKNFAGSTITAFESTGWTNVFSGTYSVPGTGVQTIDLTTPFVWDGTSNILVSVCFNNAAYGDYSSLVYGTTLPGMVVHAHTDLPSGNGCTDLTTPSSGYDVRANIYLTIIPSGILPTGIVQGFVTNGFGVPVPDATVAAQGDNGTYTTISGPTGAYMIDPINIGTYTMAAVKDGYNLVTIDGVVISDGTTTYQNFELPRPAMAVTPNPYSVTVNPNEQYQGALNINNNGDGTLTWTAEVVYPETDLVPGIDPNIPLVEFSSLPAGEISTIGAGNGQALSSREGMNCPEESKFSNAPSGSNNGYTSTTGAGYKCYQEFVGVDGSFTTLTFWAIFTAAPPATMNFNIEICNPGATPGSVITSLNVDAAPVNTNVPVIGYATYYFTVELPSTEMASGWISVQATTASPTFYWLNTMTGTGGAYQNAVSLAPERLAMCLSGAGANTGWLTMAEYEGIVNPYTNFDAPVFFNAEGTEAGEVYTADIVFTSDPDVGTVTVPVTMVVAGPPLAMPEDLTAMLTNAITGQVGLSWTFVPTDDFVNFIVKRDGVALGTTAGNTFTDMLPAYGTYYYTVQAVYDEGFSVPAGPVELEWPNPILFLDPTSLYNEQYTNSSENVTFRIGNTGEGALAFSFPEYVARQLVSSPGFTPNVRSTVKEVEVAKGEVDPTSNMGNRNLRGAGGPDGFGYFWIDSDESGGPNYVWNDISGTGTLLTGLTDDSFVGPVNLGINFPFYANSYSQVYVSSNGFLSFGSGNSSLSNQNIPSSTTPNDLISWFWDDLNPSVSGTVHYQTIGNEFVIQFTNYNEYGGSGQITAQVRLNTQGAVKIYYNTITGGLDISSATVGIENADGTIATNVNYNSAYVHNSLALHMSVTPPTFITAVTPAQGQVAPGEYVDVVATFTSEDETFPVGTYTAELELNTNDLSNEVVMIPATMVVYQPAQFAGTVTNALNGEPLNGVLVTANPSGVLSTLTYDDGTAESGWGINAGYDAYLGNYFPVAMSGTINSIDLHFIPPYGVDMTSPLTIDFFDINHVLIGTSSSFLVTAADWYNVAVPGVEFNGPFYAMVHWNITGGIRYMSWDTNGPNAASGLGYIMEADVWSNTDLGAGVFILRANVFAGTTMANMVLDPTQVMPSADRTQMRPSLSLVTGSANAGSQLNADNGRDMVSFQTMTNEEGEYSLLVDPGLYNVSFEKTGFQTYVEYDTTALAGIVTPLDAELWEESYPPSFVYAEVNADDTECVVTWGDGSGPYEVVYDDGSAENFAAWAIPGNMNAVKFTPAEYPATIIGGKFYVGDGSFPNNNTGFLGSTFGAMVKAADGTNGLPGTTLDSISVTVNNYGWVTFTGLDVELTEGDFYLVMVQGALSPNCAPIGIDEDIPTLYRSYSRNVGTGGNWGLSPFQDMMMRAIVFGSPAPTDAIASQGDAHLVLKQRGMISANSPLAMGGIEGKAEYRAAVDFEDGTRAVTSYRVIRYSNFDPNGDPSTGTKVGLGNAVSGNTYTDGGATWAGLPNGWYAYGVAANYPNNFVSDTIISNIVGHGILAEVTVNVTLTTGGSPAGAVVMLTGQDYPYEMYMETVPESGQVIFPEVWYGHYVVDAMKVGFDDYTVNVNITGDRTINIMLAEKKYKPRNLYVDALTLVATWDEPLAIAVGEDFEGATFPPAGWQALTQNTTGWYATTNGSSGSWTIPSHSKYAVTNDDADNGDGCCDYLITPEMDWTNLPSYRLNFASFYDGAFSQSAYVEISTDAGATWTVISTLATATTWVDLEIDLAQYSGVNGLASVWLAFHADDNGVWASGWAVDDVQILSGGVPFNGYGVFLDGTLVDNTPEETYTYQDLNYGQEYLAGVAALFSSGYSELDTYRFRSLFLYPPDSLQGESPYNTDYAHLWWQEPGGGSGGAGGSFIEDFEAGVLGDGWEIIQTNTAAGGGTPAHWTINDYSSADFAPFGVYHAGLWWDYGHQDEWLITPEVACGAASTLTFESTVYEGSTYLDHYYVKVSTDGGANWDVVWDASTLGGGGWNYYDYPYSIDLSAYAGDDIKIAFQAIDGDGAGLWYIWFVDNIAFGDADGVTMFPANSLTKISNSTNRGSSSDRIARDGNTARGANAQMHANRSVMGLIGYNLYRDGDLTAYVEHPTTEYFDLNLDPGTYSYHVTAVYDLTPYGFAGQTGESMIEGPIDVTVTYGYDLPFTEDWNTGLFETNQWTIDGDNWRIAGQTGNPAPSAEFFYNPVQTDYALSLTSSWINGIGMDGYIDGKFYLDFDLKLQDVNETGEENLQVEVFNGSAWVTVATYTAEGNMAWEMKHVDITSPAKNKVFRVRFNAKGMNTLDIFNWQIDNIHIYRVCAPPTELTATINFPAVDEVLLNWEAPTGGGGGGPSAWLGWDNGTNNDAIGLTGGGTFSVAVRFTPAQLGEYAGTSLTKMRFFPYAAGTFVLKVWTGANASQLVLTQPLASVVVGEWNEVALTTPVPVTGAEELWFGYTVTHAANDFPAGVDAGPAVAGFGDMISLDGSVWESMATAYALNYNWNINGYVESVDGVVALQPINDNTVYGPVSRLALGNLPMSPHATVTNTAVSSGRELVGYNVWRAIGIEPKTIIGTTTETTYLDETVEIGNLYCYQVQAVYEDCESDPSNEVCILVDNVPVVESGAVSVYPNPSNNVVNIELTNNISQLVVYNFVGQVVYEQVITKDKTIQLNVRNYEAGAYLIKFITTSGESFTKKVAVTH